jgi:hypothetical protein
MMKQFLLVVLASMFTCLLQAQHLASNKQGNESFNFPERSFPNKVPRVLDNIPVQHFPRPGECRIWYPDRSVGEQPPPMKCEVLIGIMLGQGAFILTYEGKAYDAEYNWKKDPNNERLKEKSGKIPKTVIDILFGPTQ